MIEKYTVRSFEKMEGHPECNMDLVEEDYFNTIDKCKEWCEIQIDIKHLNFEIHHSMGATNYLFGIGCGTGLISWIEKKYDEHDFPSVRPWWSIYNVPSEVDAMCQGEKF